MVFDNVLLLKGYKVDTLGVIKFLWYLNTKGILVCEELNDYTLESLGATLDKNKEIILRKNYDDDGSLTDTIEDVNDIFKQRYDGISIHRPVCCSTSKDYIIGRVVKEYEREDKRCKDCDKYTLCDRCIGYVKGGWFDIDDIFEHMTKIDDNRVCNHCYKIHDKTFTRCKECKALKKIRVYDDIDNPLEYPKFEKHQSYYLTLDDCTSCS